MAKVIAEDAVVRRLAPICVVRFKQDPGKDQKLEGWATMPGEQAPDGKVADECAKLLVRIS